MCFRELDAIERWDADHSQPGGTSRCHAGGRVLQSDYIGTRLNAEPPACLQVRIRRGLGRCDFVRADHHVEVAIEASDLQRAEDEDEG
jgi:hypothetical protein